MDAYDIFKKLTVGLKFKNKVLRVNNQNVSSKPVSVKKEEILEIKDEVLSEEDEEISNESETEDLQLVEGVEVAEKKKKKKHKNKTEDQLKKLELEEQNRYRNEHGIKTVGRHVPAALQDFSDLVQRYNLSQALVDTLKMCGYKEPTPVQRQALPCMLEDRQIFACAPTGSGKTAAFLVPILHALGTPQGGPRALVLCPTRELAQQIYREALRLSVSTELRCSVVRSVKQSKIKEREATIRKSDIVISTPNRLCYLLDREDVNISLEKIQWLVIDEADKLFEGSAEQNSAFRRQLQQVVDALGPRRRIALFSATHTPALAKWCRHQLRGLINITVGLRNAATNLVDQELLYCGNESGKLVAFRRLVQQGLKPPVLVFVQSKERAKQLFKELLYDGVSVDAIHAGRTQAQRDNVVRSFRVGRVWVLICTELMGRGIDFRGVNLVINYDFPPSAISYIHRVGRAGRAGIRGRAVTFFTQEDVGNLRSIAAVMKQSGCEVPEYMLSMKQNRNKRRKLAHKAPRRDNISTILQKASKRKLEDGTASEKPEKPIETNDIKSGKSKKHRKVQNGGEKTQNGRKDAKSNGERSKKKVVSGTKTKIVKKNYKHKLGSKKNKNNSS